MSSRNILSMKMLYRKFSLTYLHKTIRCCSQKLEARYSKKDKEKILKIANESESETLSRYTLTKGRIKSIMKWRQSNGIFKSISDVEFVEGFGEQNAQKFFDSVVEWPQSSTNSDTENNEKKPKIKGHILNPMLSDAVREKTKRVVSVNVTASNVSWCVIESAEYRLDSWGLLDTSVPDGKKLQLSDLLDKAWNIVSHIPEGCLFVLEAPATTLRASGADSSNPRVITINLQHAQLVAALVALISCRNRGAVLQQGDTLDNVVYFLRRNLSSRLFRTLLGNERVSSEATVLSILDSEYRTGTDISVPANLRQYFLSQREMEKEVLGQSLLLALTFMKVCFYSHSYSTAN